MNRREVREYMRSNPFRVADIRALQNVLEAKSTLQLLEIAEKMKADLSIVREDLIFQIVRQAGKKGMRLD